MSTKINLQSIRKYNPGLLKDEDVINNFLVRQKTFHTLINQIKNEEQDSIPQHHLIIGQRGMGKTTLLKRIEVEVRQDAVLSANFIPLQFPEELYNIDRLSKFWLNTIDVLIDYLETKNEKNLCNKFEKQMNKLTNGGEHSFSANEAYTLFMSMMSEIKKRPILLVDNLDLVFEGLNSDEQWQLREKMSKSGAPIFFGASAAPFDAVFDYKQAFYDYFKLTTLNPLTYESFYDLIIALAESLDDEKIKSSFYTNRNRIKTLFRLTGGNIRTAIILFSSLSAGFGTNVSDDLEKLLDEVTPIYKARVDELSDQMRIIADTIALYWDPIDLQKLRDITFLENNTLSPQIRRLRQMGWITKVPSSKTKGDKYEITERFFNVWYLMRRSTRRHRKNITCLSRFVEEYYGEELHQIARSLISKPLASENDIILRMAFYESIKDKKLKSQLDSNIQDGLNLVSENDPEIYQRLGLENTSSFSTSEYYKLLINKKYREADDWLSMKIKLFPKNTLLTFQKGYLNQVYLHNYDVAKDFFLKTIDINPKITEAWNNLGSLYHEEFKEYDKAKEAYLMSIQIDPENKLPWYNLGNLYQYKFKEYEKALEVYQNALNIAPNYLDALNNLGNLYQYQLKDFGKAKEMYDKVLEIDPEFSYSLINLGNLYSNHFKDYDKAKNLYEKGIEGKPDDSYAWNNLGNLYHLHLKDFKKAEEAFINCITRGQKPTFTLNKFGNLSSQTKDYQNAKKAYLEDININPSYANAWNGLGNLYQDHFLEFEEAKEAYEIALKCDPSQVASKYNLIFLLRDNLNQKTESYALFMTIDIANNLEYIDSYYLNQSLFHIYDLNFGLASESLKVAIEKLEDKDPVNTFDDWIRYASVCIKKGFGSEILDIFREYKIDIIMRPYYEACVAYQYKDKDHFQDIALEVREIAKEIYEQLVSYQKQDV
jgi:tetratricopeptide (TPR) repeat protein